MNSSDVQTFVDSFADKMHELSTQHSLAEWDLATTGAEAAQQRTVDLEVRYAALFQSREDFDRVKSWRASADQLPPDLRRCLELLYLAFLTNHADLDLSRKMAELASSMQGAYINFRASFRGHEVSDNVLRDTLRTAEDSETAQHAWEAGKEIGSAVYESAIQLARLRNRAAQESGFENYYPWALATQELDERALLELLETLEHITSEPYRQTKEILDKRLATRFGVSVDQLRPWHYGEPFFQELPEAADPRVEALFAERDPVVLGKATFNGLNMRLDDVLERSDLYERAHKDQHAFCTHIDRLSPDVRVLANLRSDLRWTGTLLHELGHAAYDTFLEPTMPYLLRDIAHISTTEAIAIMMGDLTFDRVWLTRIAAAPAEAAEAMSATLAAERRFNDLIFIRWALVVIHFEHDLYQNPDRTDLNHVWWQLVNRFQFLNPPGDRDRPDWAAKIHIALYPAYYQNYVIGMLTAAQLRRVIDCDYGGLVDSTAAGEFLKERLFRLGARYPWNETIKRVTGEYLQPNYFAEKVRASQ
ncbi:MAG: M2 family metallopeptidase [Chloroflexota bacterium]